MYAYIRGLLVYAYIRGGGVLVYAYIRGNLCMLI